MVGKKSKTPKAAKVRPKMSDREVRGVLRANETQCRQYIREVAAATRGLGTVLKQYEKNIDCALREEYHVHPVAEYAEDFIEEGEGLVDELKAVLESTDILGWSPL